jgi:glycosyltransferase involved in cell wall biosynthesis
MITQRAAVPTVVDRPRFVFVLEQTQGHVAHSRNLERLLESDGRFEAGVIHVRQSASPRSRHIPLLRSWSWQASSSARAALLRRLKRGQPDALLIHTQVAALRATDIMRAVPTVISMDATPKNYDEMGAYRHRRQAAILERIKTRINARAFGAARAFVPWSTWAAESLVHDYGIPRDLIRVIRPGVDLTKFRPRASARRPGPTRILFVGGDFERKGGPELIQALLPLGDRCELHAVTNGEPTAPSAGLRCHFYRNLKPQTPRLLELFEDADLFVLPTKAECYGIVIPEAMACGLPVISSPIGAIPELVHDGVNGYLVPPSSVRELSTAIETLVENPELRAAMGARGLAMARRDHDVKASFDAIVNLLFEIGVPACPPR